MLQVLMIIMSRIQVTIYSELNYDNGYWLLATGYWHLDDRIKLLGFSISCQKPKARGQKPPWSQVMVPSLASIM